MKRPLHWLGLKLHELFKLPFNMTQAKTSRLHNFTVQPGLLLLPVLALLTVGGIGCQRTQRDRSDAISQKLTEAKTKTDDLRKAMRHLASMNPVNSQNMSQAVRLELNTWLRTVEPSSVKYSTPALMNSLPKDKLELVGCATPVELQFDYWDIDYLYERSLMQKLSSWIVEFPLRDNLIGPVIEAKQKQLSAEDAHKLEEAYKLFDWTIRNIVLAGEDSSSVEARTRDPRGPINDRGIGYGYLPWETLLFSRGDFVERGRVFTALARQRNIDTFWVTLGAAPEAAGDLFAIGVLVGNELLLFEPKLGLPILDPDKFELATLQDVQGNARILKRLDLAGQFDYAFEADDVTSVQLLIDLPPVAASARMKILEQALLGDERMVVYTDVDELKERALKALPDVTVHMWWTPLLAQLQAASVRERLRDTTPFTLGYMANHGVWMLKTPASEGRLMHLAGEFENTPDRRGALATYMDTRIDDESIKRLAYDPRIQKELGVARAPSETREAFDMRMAQTQVLFSRSKVDAAFLLSQLHFDRGNYEAAKSWLKNRVVDVEKSVEWHAAGWYALSRAYQELGEMEEAEKALIHLPTSLQANPQEPGNRLRLRLLRQQ